MTTVECPTCGAASAVVWRCEACGADLAGETATEGREEA
jgi:predicted RNA-binding Zn-ribbon protein involved in translation (DUF1610 family)